MDKAQDMKQHLQNVDMDKMRFVLDVKGAFERGELTLDQARAKLRERIDVIRPYEIALAEQELQEFDADECRKEDIQKMLDLYQGLMDTSRPELPADHPIACYYRENDEMRKHLLAIEDLVQYPVIKNQWYEIYDQLDKYRLHFSRKQNQLYSVLEKKGFDRPTTTMWTLDDFIRDEISELRGLLDAGKEEEFIERQATLVADVRDLMQKEETVLYPTSLAMIKPAEFEDMKSGDREIGFAWIEVDHKPSAAAEASAAPEKGEGLAGELAALLAKHGYGTNADQVFDVATGKLTLNQINLIYKHLPVDISYVDENEIVKFYSDTDHRVFPRSKNVIGRDVKNCHPRNSVHIVKEIIEKFRSGEQDRAEFWINKPGLFIYIYYVAVRDENGQFKGIMEMMQDCTHIRSLQGSQTLLTWDNQQKGEGEAEAETEAAAETETETEAAAPAAPASGERPALTPDTLLKDLIARYPALKKDVAQINPAFKMLQTPLARVMLPKATIAMMSERSGSSVEEIISGINKLIDSYEA